MMKKLFILACVCLLITSCNSNSKNTNDSATSTETTDMHNAENSLDYDGTYTGTFPAADCPGINMTLTIKKDKTFELISEYIDRQDATFKEYGTYSVEGNIMTLINGEDKQYYKVGENTLIALNQDKQAITYNPQIQISAESETKRSIFREKDKTKRSKKESAQHSKSRNKSFVMTSVSAL